MRIGAGRAVRFDDMIETVLAQPLTGEAVRATVYRQLVDLAAQGKAEHDDRLATRVYAALDDLREHVPSAARAAMIDALVGFAVPSRLIAHFSGESARDIAPFITRASLAPEQWLAILPAMSQQARSLLRSRRDVDERVKAALEAYGPADLALNAPPVAPDVEEEVAPAPVSVAPESPVEPSIRPEPTAAVERHEVEAPQATEASHAARRRVDNLFVPTAEPTPVETGATAPAALHEPSVITGENQVQELLRRIEDYRARSAAAGGVRTGEEDISPEEPEGSTQFAPQQWSAPQAKEFRWESDTSGTIVWVDGVRREAVIGRSVAFAEIEEIEGVEMRVATAFARRAPFRDGRFTLPGSGEASGLWHISGVPYFDSRSGRFGGFRGTAKRPLTVAVVRPAAETAAATDASKGNLSPDAVRQMTHELKTPLNAIVGFAEMIEQQMLGPAADPYRQQARGILGDAQRLLAAIDDLDTAARGTGPRTEGPPLVDAGRLVERIISRYRELSSERGIEVIGSIARGLPAIDTSEEVLERVIARLFAAVIGAAREGDRLTYGVGAAPGDSVRIFLSRPQSLVGQDAETLFDPASSGFAAGREAQALGLGFGLRLVRQLASALGGHFEIEDTLFILTLPSHRRKKTGTGNVA